MAKSIRHGSNIWMHEDGWDDLRSPAQAINPPGAASDPDVDPNTGLLLFAAGGTELVYVTHQMPHSWEYSTDISPHIHWAKTTSASGDVTWRIRYKKWLVGGVLDAAWTELNAEGVAAGTPDNDTADEQLIATFANLPMSDMDISDSVLYEIARIGGDAGDTYGADATLIEFDSHYLIGSLGSENEFSRGNF